MLEMYILDATRVGSTQQQPRCVKHEEVSDSLVSLVKRTYPRVGG
jgi:hypothetical protein